MGIEIDGEYYSFWRNEPPQSPEDEDSLEVGLDHANTEHEGTDTMRAKGKTASHQRAEPVFGFQYSDDD